MWRNTLKLHNVRMPIVCDSGPEITQPLISAARDQGHINHGADRAAALGPHLR